MYTFESVLLSIIAWYIAFIILVSVSTVLSNSKSLKPFSLFAIWYPERNFKNTAQITLLVQQCQRTFSFKKKISALMWECTTWKFNLKTYHLGFERNAWKFLTYVSFLSFCQVIKSSILYPKSYIITYCRFTKPLNHLLCYSGKYH